MPDVRLCLLTEKCNIDLLIISQAYNIRWSVHCSGKSHKRVKFLPGYVKVREKVVGQGKNQNIWGKLLEFFICSHFFCTSVCFLALNYI